MNLELDDQYHIWKIKLQLAQQGNTQALQDIKLHCFNGKQQLSFIENNLHDSLKNAKIKYMKQNQSYGNYELFNQVPIFLLLAGQIQIKCLNLQGDEQTFMKLQEKGVGYVSRQKVKQKYGQSNINIVTKYNLVSSKNSIIIEISQQSRKKIQNGQKQSPFLVGLRQQTIMKKYMLFPLKYIRIQQYNSNVAKCQEKFYLLQGRACYYYQKNKQKILLTVYQQGYINPKQFTNNQILLYIFENSKILIFEQQFMRDDVIAGIQSKRNQHIQGLIKSYEKLSLQEKKKTQLKLVNYYRLNKKQLDKAVFGIVQPVVKDKQQSSKRISTKNDLISTSSSIKQKCKIRISKKKKII